MNNEKVILRLMQITASNKEYMSLGTRMIQEIMILTHHLFVFQEAERILKKANKTHKEKVEDFNRHLDSLTEHFDIPKVSWTK